MPLAHGPMWANGQLRRRRSLGSPDRGDCWGEGGAIVRPGGGGRVGGCVLGLAKLPPTLDPSIRETPATTLLVMRRGLLVLRI